MTDEQNRQLYHDEYRAMLKAVLSEALSDNDSRVRSIFKEAVKEWLSERMRDGEAWTVKIIALVFVGVVLWLILR